jgi:hypothetical protein
MEKRTLYALIAVIALGAGAFAVMRSPQKGERQGPAPRPVPEIKAADVARLELTNGKQEKTVLEKKGDEWRITAPADWKADQNAVKQLTDALARLSFGDTVSENAAKHAELGVADGKAPRVVAKNASGTTRADLLIGKTIGGYTMARVAGKNEVWQESGVFPYVLDKEPKGWRDHAIFAFSAADASKLAVEAGADKLVLDKDKAGKDKTAEAKWKVAESAGAAPKSTDGLDQTQANAAVSGLSNLHASDFVDDKKPEDVHKTARVTLTVTAKDKPHTLCIGAVKGEDVTVATPDSPTVYTVKKFSLDHIMRGPIDYRDKTLVKAKESELASVQITDGGQTTTLTQGKDGKWKTAKGAADDTKVKPVVSSFENLQASGFAEDKEPAKTGLAKPQGEVVLHLKNKETVTLKVGAATKDGDYYVQKVGSPDVYLVKKYAVDRWLKKPADLVAKK